MQPSKSSAPRLRLVGQQERDWPSVSLDDFDAMYRRYAPYVATIGLRILGRADDVDDLVQEVFITAHGQLDQLKHPERIRGWLSTIAVRKAMKRLRRLRLTQFWVREDSLTYESLADPSASPEHRAEIGRVYRALESMHVSDRVVWLLKHVEGQTLDEIVESSGISKSTVQRRLKKTEERLRRRSDDVKF